MSEIRAISCTSMGVNCDVNEDAMLVAAGPGLFAVADGMGGVSFGDVASQAAIQCLNDAFAAGCPDDEAVPACLQQGFTQANDAVIQLGAEAQATMGTTMTAVVVRGRRAWVAHCGDSRAYLLHDGKAHRLTDDHRLVEDMLRKGYLGSAEAKDHPRRHVLTAYLGRHEKFRLQALTIDLPPGSRLLLCTDGLLDPLGELALADRTWDDLTAETIVGDSRQAGGWDDMTVVVVTPAEEAL